MRIAARRLGIERVFYSPTVTDVSSPGGKHFVSNVFFFENVL